MHPLPTSMHRHVLCVLWGGGGSVPSDDIALLFFRNLAQHIFGELYPKSDFRWAESLVINTEEEWALNKSDGEAV